MLPHLSHIHAAMTSHPAADNRLATVVHLQNAGGMTASFMDMGATWLSANLPVGSERREVLLRSLDMQAHLEQSAYFGSIVGRYANRIKGSRFSLNGIEYILASNEGKNTLHGGPKGFDTLRWEIVFKAQQQVTFQLNSRDGDQGFPGNFNVTVTYTLTDDNAVEIRYEGLCDADCPISLTNHAYFNLDGESSGAKCLDHSLQLRASHYLPTRDDMTPKSEWLSVMGTTFDFNTSKNVGRDFLQGDDQVTAGGYDHAFILESACCDGKAVVALVRAQDEVVSMAVSTTKPSIQFYSGNFLDGSSGASHAYDKYEGLALETQYLPDGPNQPQWGTLCGIQKANVPYQHLTRYQFIF
ncbi:galactose-1-epimerase [Enterovibrio gelatinilyticus]